MVSATLRPAAVRCAWARTELMAAYHDAEWGTPVHDDHMLFEFVTLEGAQAGLSWETVLKKRARYREAFAGFDPAKVARFTPARVERLLQDPGLIRHRGKIESTVSNAKALLAVQREFGSFHRYVWGFVNGRPRETRTKSNFETHNFPIGKGLRPILPSVIPDEPLTVFRLGARQRGAVTLWLHKGSCRGGARRCIALAGLRSGCAVRRAVPRPPRAKKERAARRRLFPVASVQVCDQKPMRMPPWTMWMSSTAPPAATGPCTIPSAPSAPAAIKPAASRSRLCLR